MDTIPYLVAQYCRERGLQNPRIVVVEGICRALADDPKGGVCLVPGDVWRAVALVPSHV